jgi:hypothetical protein
VARRAPALESRLQALVLPRHLAHPLPRRPAQLHQQRPRPVELSPQPVAARELRSLQARRAAAHRPRGAAEMRGQVPGAPPQRPAVRRHAGPGAGAARKAGPDAPRARRPQRQESGAGGRGEPRPRRKLHRVRAPGAGGFLSRGDGRGGRRLGHGRGSTSPPGARLRKVFPRPRRSSSASSIRPWRA